MDRITVIPLRSPYKFDTSDYRRIALRLERQTRAGHSVLEAVRYSASFFSKFFSSTPLADVSAGGALGTELRLAVPRPRASDAEVASIANASMKTGVAVPASLHIIENLFLRTRSSECLGPYLKPSKS